MSSILVTGGTGNLGRHVTSRLLKHRHSVRVMSNESNPSIPERAEFLYGDFGSGQGLEEAATGVDTIVHLATTWRRAQDTQLVDVEGTRRLLEAAKAHSSPHFIYMSIVGVDQSQYFYYKAKYDAEMLVEKGGVPWTIQRSTQFHNFVLWMLQSLKADTQPEIVVPSGVRFQPIDVGEAADRLVSLVERGPSGRVPEIGGPQVLTIEQATESYLRVRGINARVRSEPLKGDMYDAFRTDAILTPRNKVGKITWEEFLISV
jgi:uncharacterized protein YbjT (DUF2867 family)